jgi:Glycoside hydrolase 123, catalytic domain
MTFLKYSFLLLLSITLLLACDDSQDEDNNKSTKEVILDSTEWTYKLSESISGLTLWTTPSTRKVTISDGAPLDEHSGIKLSAAGNEFEPFQIIASPGNGELTISMEPFSTLGAEQKLTIHKVGFSNGWADSLTPCGDPCTITLSSSQPTPIWFTVYLPQDAPSGEQTTTISITRDQSLLTIPVTLYVFNFQLPRKINFATQLNVSISDLIPQGGSVDDAKTILYEHRMTPKSVSWPSGFNWSITWDTPHSSDRCNVLWDEPQEPNEYSIGWLSKRYILGQGWNETGFPNSMIFQFVNNSTPRPDTFCDIPRGDHYGSTEYNNQWSQFLGEMQNYLTTNGMISKAYYYIQNEPQNEEDHNLAAHLCSLTKAAAPNLRIAISEEPKPEIAEINGCGYDIWIAHIRSYQKDYAWSRQENFGEEVWFYSLDHDPDPWFNPTLIEAQGMNQRIIPWVSWTYRVSGWAYYDFGRFFNGSLPSIRAELFREGFEDYEYLYLANSNSHPSVSSTNDVDQTVASVASSLTSWNKNPDALMTLRHQLGLFIEGTRGTLPILEINSDIRTRGEYNINFQNPQGDPLADPLIVNDSTWIKTGWMGWDESLGYGWYGENIENSSIAVYGYDNTSGYNEVEKSYIYDDYGRANLFEFSLANGRYLITLSVGRPAKGYLQDPHNATIEGVVVVDDELTTDETPTITRSVEIQLTDGSISLEIGGKSQSTDNFAYTFLQYMTIVPID